jgi:alkanesulfonate monooxygenase SsuD/methylene tetrahydromethanopterin reductase-like flavin-dependent oxidoreductase (luciferase family)
VIEFSVIIRGQHLGHEDIRVRMRQDLEQARLAGQLGFAGISRGSHFSAHPFQYVQMIPFLARAVAEAPGLRVICGLALLPLHNPLDLAEQLASLDVISDGRLVFGAGLGYRDVEFRAFGTTRAESGRRFEETLEAILRLWREEFVDLRGSHFDLEHANCSVKPLGTPPVWIGGGTPRAIRRAARMGDTWYVDPFKTGAMIERGVEVYRAALAALGRPFPAEFPVMREIFVARTRVDAVRIARPSLEIKYKAYDSWGQGRVDPDNPLDRDFEGLAHDRFLLGTPDQVVAQIVDLHRRTGLNHFVLGIHWPGMAQEVVVEQMHMLAEEVFPAVRKALA